MARNAARAATKRWRCRQGVVGILALLLIVAGLSAGATPALAATAMDDDFDDNSLDLNRWQVSVPPGGSIAEQNQRLEITVPSGFPNQGWGVGSRCSLAGDFDVQVDFAILDWPLGNQYVLRLGAADLGPNTGIIRVSNAGGSLYALLLDPGGVPAFEASTSDQTGSLRLVRSGPTLSGYYRQGDTWVLLGSGATSENPGSARIHIDSSNDTAGAPPGRVAFDNFTVNAGTVSCPDAPALQLAELRAAVEDVGSGTSLADKVESAQAALAEGDDASACEILGAFINQVEAQSGKKIAVETATALIADATQIRAALGC